MKFSSQLSLELVRTDWCVRTRVRTVGAACSAALVLLLAGASRALPKPQASTASAAETVVFWAAGFPVADTVAPDRTVLAALPRAEFVDEEKLREALAAESTRLLVMPFGSPFPAEAWQDIHRFLESGGNLLVIGGRPFTRPAYKEKSGAWELGAANQAYARELFLNDYQETPGSSEAVFTANEDFAFARVPSFAWKRAWSATVRLSDEELYPREGSAGTIDARLDTLAWGVKGGRKVSAPVIEIDHLQNQFEGGRWILVNAELGADFWASGVARELISRLANRGLRGAEEFRVQPAWAAVAAGEPVTLNVRWRRFGTKPARVRIEWSCALAHAVAPAHDGEACTAPEKIEANRDGDLFAATVPLAGGVTGLHSLTAKVFENDEPVAIYRTGFWVIDPRGLKDGPRIGTSGNYFTRDGQTMMVVGTTYMASDVQRQFLMRPNPAVWDRDMQQIQDAGINTIRTGWWTGWDQVMKESGEVREEALRAVEAFLLTARAHGLAVQFTFFAFTPDVFGGENPYLDPKAIERQKELIGAVVGRFKDAPFVSWDLINEPSFSNPKKNWQTRPNGDRFELRAWNDWLAKRYARRAALADAWHTVVPAESEPIGLPDENEFSSAATFSAWPADNSLRAQDYTFFAQDAFAEWARTMRDAIRATGSKQLVTVGQDEGGGEERPSPSFFGAAMDFTTTHSWWAQDALLWDSLMAIVPGKPMLVQETGISHEVQADGSARRTLEEEARLFARKLAIAGGSGAGAIEWLWNVNDYMRDDREATIGAIRPDGTEKPEAEVLRKFAAFAAAAGPHLSGAVGPQVAVMTSQALQFSRLQSLATEAQHASLRVLNYGLGVPSYVIPENLAPQMLGDSAARPKLVVLPSAQALGDAAWKALVAYAAGGGTVLITGSVERDAHFGITHRMAELGAAASPASLLLRGNEQQIGDEKISLSFAAAAQESAEYLKFEDGKSFHGFSRGSGKIFVASEPVELAEGMEDATALYTWVLSQAGVRAAFDGRVPDAVMVRPVELQDAVLYLIVSESASDAQIDVRDRVSGARVAMNLAAGSSHLVLLDKKTGRVISEFAH